MIFFRLILNILINMSTCVLFNSEVSNIAFYSRVLGDYVPVTRKTCICLSNVIKYNEDKEVIKDQFDDYTARLLENRNKKWSDKVSNMMFNLEFSLNSESLEIYNRTSEIIYTRINVYITMSEDMYIFGITGNYNLNGEPKRSGINLDEFIENYLKRTTIVKIV